eukprot:TRINITY_DN1416_c0_g1_i1.p1 TRINITY_DN1416_c0_g1~~TRINITY_DN1416_c0_g1_i1.p1  ORF type:complete len:120 (+),score=11.50 TRINITY_DN1416_c0_g1_i1:730-1089(+)
MLIDHFCQSTAGFSSKTASSRRSCAFTMSWFTNISQETLRFPLSNSPSNLSIQFLSLSFIPFSSSNIPAAAGACVMTVSDVNSYSYASFSPSVLRGGAVFLHNSLIILRACNNTNDAML